MVESMILLRVLDSHDVLDVLHHADRRHVAAKVGAYRTGVAIANVVADATVLDLLLQSSHGISKLRNAVSILPQQVQHEPQGRLAPDARQL